MLIACSKSDERQLVPANPQNARLAGLPEADTARKAAIGNRTRANTFPFDQATQLVVLAHASTAALRNRQQGDYINYASIADGQLVLQEIYQRFVLNDEQTDAAFSLLYAYRANKSPSMPALDCFTPHHTLVFYRGNRVIAFLELSLECDRVEKTAGIELERLSPDQRCQLAGLFKTIGIKQGLDVIERRCRLQEEYQQVR